MKHRTKYERLRAAFLAVVAFSCFAPAGARADRAFPEDLADATHRHFFSDDIVLYGKDAAGQDFLLDLMLCRKEDAAQSTFLHYRYISLIYAGVNKNFTESMNDPHSEEVPFESLPEFTEKGNSDLSVRESYAFTLRIAGQEIKVEIPELEGDFLIKNSPEYTKYASESPAMVRIGQKSFPVRAFVTKIHSSDFNRYVFFPGYGRIASETHSFVLWDKVGNVYLLDTSRVEKDNPAYRSHTWVLMKDTKAKSMRKAFEVHVSLQEEKGGPQSWDISLPTLDGRKIHLDAMVRKDGKPQEGLASGSVRTVSESSDISGMYVHHVYAEK